ncbi:MAG: hypothetical protein FWE18_02250 [Alphaproteobacteria bacterium]|nr:hypothetical protein [Alphaproteobacteria bacterium]
MTNNVRVGDVAVFEAEDDWISKSIALVTNSDVSHAALVYKEMTFAEMGLSGIQSNPFVVDEKAGRKVYFLRMTPEKNVAPIVAAAQKYLDAKVEYDKPSLYLLAGYLIYRMVRKPTAKWKNAADLIIAAAILAVDKMINQVKNNGKKVMVCSQFVYQCYFDCGKEYRINVRQLDTALNNNQFYLADLMKETSYSKFDEVSFNTAKSEDELAKDLYDALTENVDESALLSKKDLFSTASKAKVFIEKLEDLLKIMSLDMPIDALFVTPVDLLKNSSNLELKETLRITRK